MDRSFHDVRFGVMECDALVRLEMEKFVISKLSQMDTEEPKKSRRKRKGKKNEAGLLCKAEHGVSMKWTLEQEPDVPKKNVRTSKPAEIARVPIVGRGKFTDK
jgi:hypothetical protein